MLTYEVMSPRALAPTLSGLRSRAERDQVSAAWLRIRYRDFRLRRTSLAEFTLSDSEWARNDTLCALCIIPVRVTRLSGVKASRTNLVRKSLACQRNAALIHETP